MEKIRLNRLTVGIKDEKLVAIKRTNGTFSPRAKPDENVFEGQLDCNIGDIENEFGVNLDYISIDDFYLNPDKSNTFKTLNDNPRVKEIISKK